MKIGILLAGHTAAELEPNHGEFDNLFKNLLAGHGFEFKTYAVVDGEFPTGANDADGWLVSGSKFSTYEDHPWIKQLEEFLRSAYAADVPIVGICFGHQILAQAMGGVNEKFAGGWSVGHQTYKWRDGRSQAIMAWHQDQVTTAPEDATCLASSDFCRYAMLSYGNKALSYQAHPEFNMTFTEDLLELRRASIPAELADEADGQMSNPLDTSNSAAQIAEFFKSRKLPC